jgi:MoxR-like ATPase
LKSWIVTATNEQKEEYIRTGVVQYMNEESKEKSGGGGYATAASGSGSASDRAAAIAAAIQASMSSGVDEDRVRELINIHATEGFRLDDETIKRISDAARKDLPVETIHIEPSGFDVDLSTAHKEFPRALDSAIAGNNMVLIGPSGTGKTYAARLIADALGATLHIQAPCMQPYDITGYERLDGTVCSTPTADWVREQGPAVLLYDELDAFAPTAQITANLILDGGIAKLPDGVHKVYGEHGQLHKIAIASANTDLNGSTQANNARHPIDRALQDRFPTRIMWGLDGQLEAGIVQAAALSRGCDEECAVRITGALVRIANRLRDYTAEKGIQTQITTRSLVASARILAIAKKNKKKASIRDTVNETMIHHFKEGTQRSGAVTAAKACSEII